jgi:TatD DNase family protein
LNLVDTHCHLNLDAFQDDLQTVLDRASEQGIQRILVPGIDIETSRTAIALAEQHSNIFAAVGVHPNDALSWNHESYEILKELADHSKVVAVGEIGLDYYRDHAPHSLQQDILQQQLRLALECGLPVVLHNRAALHDLCPAIYAWQNALEQNGSPLAKRPGVLHSYDGDLETALSAASQHFFIGISGPVTFRNAPDRQQVVAGLPIEKMVLETDAPFLAPHPRRGRRNEPAYVSLIAEKVAELHNLSLSTLSQLTTDNAGQLFGWGVFFEY